MKAIRNKLENERKAHAAAIARHVARETALTTLIDAIEDVCLDKGVVNNADKVQTIRALIEEATRSMVAHHDCEECGHQITARAITAFQIEANGAGGFPRLCEDCGEKP